MRLDDPDDGPVGIRSATTSPSPCSSSSCSSYKPSTASATAGPCSVVLAVGAPVASTVGIELVVVAVLQVPQPVGALRLDPTLLDGVVLVGVVRVEPAGAEIAKVRVAAVARHVVAAHGLGHGCLARRARRRVLFNVFQRLQVRLGHVGRLGRAAIVELAVPRRLAAAAKGKAARVTDAHLGWRVALLVGVFFGLGRSLALGIVALLVTLLVAAALVQLEALWLLVPGRAGRARAPLPWAEDCILVCLELSLVREIDVALHEALVDGDLEQLARTDQKQLRLLVLLGRLAPCLFPLLGAVRLEASHRRQLTLSDGIAVEVL